MASSSPHERWPAPEDDELLPSNYDQLIPIDRLTQDRHNPSVAQPSDGLRRSVATEAFQHAQVPFNCLHRGHIMHTSGNLLCNLVHRTVTVERHLI